MSGLGNLSRLPPNVLNKIFGKVNNTISRARASETSKNMRKVFRPQLLKNKFLKQMENHPPLTANNTNKRKNIQLMKDIPLNRFGGINFKNPVLLRTSSNNSSFKVINANKYIEELKTAFIKYKQNKKSKITTNEQKFLNSMKYGNRIYLTTVRGLGIYNDPHLFRQKMDEMRYPIFRLQFNNNRPPKKPRLWKHNNSRLTNKFK